MADGVRGLEEQAIRRQIAAAREANPGARIICLVDRRSSGAGALNTRTFLAVPRSSAWFELMPDEQIVELLDRDVYDRGSSSRLI